MPIDILVGLQYGSEGKGKISSYLADEYDVSVRVGGWQSGHTFEHDGTFYKMRQLPCQWTNPHARLIIGAGALIKLDVLNSEIELIENNGYSIRNRLYIDERAVIIKDDSCSKQESNEGMFMSIGSTQEGVGEALIRKIKRNGTVFQAKNCPEIRNNVIDTIELMNEYNEKSLNIFIEGNQGSHLSIITSKHYPFCTSSDCNASGILSSCGLSPFDVRNIIGVMRTYPIRVAGNSGNTGEKEITWGEVTSASESPKLIKEKTTVTNRIRRVFKFSDSDILQSLEINKPNILALNFMDYIDFNSHGAKTWDSLSHKTRNYLTNKQYNLGNIKFDLLGTGQNKDQIIDLRS